MEAFLHRMKHIQHQNRPARTGKSVAVHSVRLCCIKILLLVLIPLGAMAQQIRFDRLSVSEGLSSNSVYTILQDSYGILWFGSLDGLNRYNGYEFTVFRHDVSNEKSISNNRITNIYEDKSRRLWLYDEFTSTIIKYTPLEEEFKAYDLKKNNDIDFDVLNSIYEDNGKLFLQSTLGYTMQYNPSGDSFDLLNKTVPLTQDSIKNEHLLLAGFDAYLKQSKNNFTVSTISIKKIIKDSGGRYWIATRYAGLFSAVFENGQFDFTSHFHTTEKFEKVDSEDILDIYEDRSNVVWVGTKNNGLYRYSRYKYKFSHIESIRTGQKETMLGTLRAITEDEHKNVWVGTNDQGVVRINPSLKTGEVYKPLPDGHSNIGHRFIRSLWIDETNRLWAGHYNGFSIYQPTTNDFIAYLPKPESQEEIRVYDFKNDKKNGVWMAGWDLIVHYNMTTKKFEFLSRSSARNIGFTNENVRELQLDDEGDLWIVLGEKGMSIHDKNSGKFTTVHYTPSNPLGLPSNNLFDILKDSKNNLWLATSDGLCRFNPVSLSCETFTVNNGLPSNLIYTLMEDKEGNLWFSSTKGIGRFDPGTGKFRNYDVTDGLQSNEFAENASHQSDDGTMYFGGINGLNVFHPQRVEDSPVAPQVVITNIKVFNEPRSEIKLLNHEAILKKLASQQEIIFSPEQRSISFEFVGLHYVNPQKNNYAYKLEGFNDQWVYQESHVRFAYYTNLEPGTYYFNVKASSSDNVWSEPVRLKIIIEKPYYATWWFISLCMGAVVATGVTAYRWRITALKKQQSMKAIQLESELNFLKSQVNPHFLFNTLNNIYALCQVNSRNAAPMVGKISEMMRYMIYDCNAKQVPVQKEVEYLHNYIDLNQLKSNRKLNVVMQVASDITELKIAPLLLINFVENAFKHGDVSENGKGFIRIEITRKESMIVFTVRNSFSEKQGTRDERSGIGLENVSHRLNLLYVNKHTLKIQKNTNVFEVELALQLTYIP